MSSLALSSADAGKAARRQAPRSSHAQLHVPPGRDPVTLLEQETRSLVPGLVPIRFGRMLRSPFAFYRGAPAVMAQDLAETPTAGIEVQLCGDAHLLNFGSVASPERRMLLDVTDFDQTLPGPFEWDVKRLAASIELAGRQRNFDDAERRGALLRALRAYRDAMREFAAMSDLDVWYARFDVSETIAALRQRREGKKLERAVDRARAKDATRKLAKLTREVDGKHRFVSDPPLLVPLAELLPDERAADLESRLRAIFRSYAATLRHDRRVLLERFAYGDLARKVVGIGSVGTRCWVLLLLGRDGRDPLFLQIKEAGPSVLEAALGPSRFSSSGRRVVEGQRLMQTASDIFLGWLHDAQELDGQLRDFYVRQLAEWKVELDLESVSPRGFSLFARACAWTLARAHARSGDRIVIAGYLGSGSSFDHAVAEFAVAYADLTEQDHAALRNAARAGRIEAEEGS